MVPSSYVYAAGCVASPTMSHQSEPLTSPQGSVNGAPPYSTAVQSVAEGHVAANTREVESKSVMNIAATSYIGFQLT